MLSAPSLMGVAGCGDMGGNVCPLLGWDRGPPSLSHPCPSPSSAIFGAIVTYMKYLGVKTKLGDGKKSKSNFFRKKVRHPIPTQGGQRTQFPLTPSQLIPSGPPTSRRFQGARRQMSCRRSHGRASACQGQPSGAGTPTVSGGLPGGSLPAFFTPPYPISPHSHMPEAPAVSLGGDAGGGHSPAPCPPRLAPAALATPPRFLSCRCRFQAKQSP